MDFHYEFLSVNIKSFEEIKGKKKRAKDGPACSNFTETIFLPGAINFSFLVPLLYPPLIFILSSLIVHIEVFFHQFCSKNLTSIPKLS